MKLLRSTGARHCLQELSWIVNRDSCDDDRDKKSGRATLQAKLFGDPPMKND
jgi:hypothetical protein